jgi:tetratricopeptide (TPR) repeat protein
MTTRALLVALVIALMAGTAAAAPPRAAAAPPRAERTHDDVVADLGKKDDVEARRGAVAWLAMHGTMADVPRLVERLRDSDAGVRTLAEAALWEVWSRSGDEATDLLLRMGVAQMNERDIAGAVDTFSQVIARRPDFAEGWNKRATVYYMLGQYEKSLADCDEVMKRNSYHFGALSGYGLIHLKLRHPEQALAWFEKALAINPNLDGIRDSANTLRELVIQKRKNTL